MAIQNDSRISDVLQVAFHMYILHRYMSSSIQISLPFFILMTDNITVYKQLRLPTKCLYMGQLVRVRVTSTGTGNINYLGYDNGNPYMGIYGPSGHNDLCSVQKEAQGAMTGWFYPYTKITVDRIEFKKPLKYMGYWKSLRNQKK